MSIFFEFDEVNAFTVGTVGRPGERTFLLQARVDDQRVTVKCEKQQTAAIVAVPAQGARRSPAGGGSSDAGCAGAA